MERYPGVGRVGRQEGIADPLLDGEFTIEHRENNRTMPGTLSTIHNQDVAGENSGIFH